MRDCPFPYFASAINCLNTNGTKESHQVKLRIDTPIEVDYYRHGGILPFVLRQLIAEAK